MNDTPGQRGCFRARMSFSSTVPSTRAPAPAATCKACGQPIQDVYYEVGGQPVCQGCSGQLHEMLRGGSPFGRFALATFYGSVAGIIGAVIYYGVRKATNIEFGLIAILLV